MTTMPPVSRSTPLPTAHSLPSQRLPSPYRPESDIVAARLQVLEGELDWRAVQQTAKPWVQAVRDNPPPFWAMETLLKEYPLSSTEGLALMRLAEALLRVPDAETAIALTADQLGKADFSAGDGNSALGKLGNLAIAQAKHFLPSAESGGLIGKLGAKTVVAATLRAVQLLGKQFVLGQTIGEALEVGRSTHEKNPRITHSFDMLGEGARTQNDADRYLDSYLNAINSIAAHADSIWANSTKSLENPAKSSPQQQDGISIKLSALHPRYEWTQHARVMHELVPRVWQLIERAAAANMNLTIDAEEVDRLELSLDVLEALVQRIGREFPQWSGFGLALQAYQTRAVELIHEVARIGRAHGVKLMCRLVKGAYWDAEIKRAQEMGLTHYPVFTHKHHTDISYLACAQALLQSHDVIFPQFATHNAGTIAAIAQMAQRHGARYELQRLHGMGEGIYREVLKNPLVSLRVYAPVGNHRDLLAYLVRRLLENGANSSFVHQLSDESVGLDELLTSPLHLTAASAQPLPAQLFGEQRRNSLGLDLADASQRAPLLAALAQTTVPVVPESDAKQLFGPDSKRATSYQKWSKTPVQERAAVLRRAADAFESQMPQLCALIVKEAFKTWGDAVAEVREAVDFLRYYALEAERIMQPIALPSPTGESNELRQRPRGTWVAISPWNFPLAIFTGQVAAALATGNAVLAKPAEQTPAIAAQAVKLLHEAGVPSDVLQLFHGPGETVGAALVALPDIAGVVFTGSTPVAKLINRNLAAKDGPITPLIAETGGINAMLVDSSALPEQVCDAVVSSAFRSAGQRCSALRLLCVHEAIADHVIAMIREAMQELVVGDTQHMATDVGPVIDAEAHHNIADYLQNMEPKRLSAHTKCASSAIKNIVAPSIIEVDRIADVKREIFGPVLHISRWSGDPMQVIEQINQLGFGLTMGIQTRIDSRALALAHEAHIGNVYVNRNIIGAVVGSQPFGGEGLSGTGPKAGGPHYLYRFVAEQTVTINTAAAGGNATLLAGH
jgi:RHH-type transcriptional regulator, proline utilization regulon repressor / proline dehydrogenase / delta 1-pyrroline-5-carboxylate dehydrogenase